jgi:hypothetical protein
MGEFMSKCGFDFTGTALVLVLAGSTLLIVALVLFSQKWIRNDRKASEERGRMERSAQYADARDLERVRGRQITSSVFPGKSVSLKYLSEEKYKVRATADEIGSTNWFAVMTDKDEGKLVLLYGSPSALAPGSGADSLCTVLLEADIPPQLAPPITPEPAQQAAPLAYEPPNPLPEESPESPKPVALRPLLGGIPGGRELGDLELFIPTKQVAGVRDLHQILR